MTLQLYQLLHTVYRNDPEMVLYLHLIVEDLHTTDNVHQARM